MKLVLATTILLNYLSFYHLHATENLCDEESKEKKTQTKLMNKSDYEKENEDNIKKTQSYKSLPDEYNVMDEYFPIKTFLLDDGKYRSKEIKIKLNDFNKIQEKINSLWTLNNSYTEILSQEEKKHTQEKNNLIEKTKKIKEENNSLSEKNKSMKTELRKLKYYAEKIEEEKEDVSDKLRRKEKQYEKLEEDYSISNKLYEKMKKEREDIGKKNDELCHELTEQKIYLTNLEAKKEDIEKEYRSLKANNGSLVQKIEKDKEFFNSGNKILNDYLREEEKKRDRQIENLQKVNDEYKNIKRENSLIEEDNKNLNIKIDNLKEEITSLLGKNKKQEELLSQQRDNYDLQILEFSQKIKQQELSFETKLKEQQLFFEGQISDLKRNTQRQGMGGTNNLNMTLEKEQEYLSYLYQTIRKAKIPCPGKPKSLIEALDILQKSFEDS